MMRILPDWISAITKRWPKREYKELRQRRRIHRALAFEPLEGRQMLATITVNTPSDVSNASDGLTTLREAIIAAAPSGDTINFSSNPTHGLVGGTITLSATQGQILIPGKSLTIDGGTLNITIVAADTDSDPDNGNGFRIFDITDPTTGTSPPLVTMKGLKLTGADSGDDGGAIRSAARLILEDMTIEGNAAFSGGGVYVAVAAGGTGNRDVLTIEDSTIGDNSATAFGGGVFVQLAATTGNHQTARIINSAFQENSAAGSGGAVYITGNSTDEGDRNAVFITSSEFELNEAGFGGAIFHTGTRIDLSIQEGTLISGNEALTFRGGGIHANIYDSKLQIQDSIISGNHADQGGINGSGGGVSALLYQSSSLNITNSEITGNYAYKDGGGVFARALYHIGGTQFPATRAITISRSLISGNRAQDRGGGLFMYTEEGTETLVEESRITGNLIPNNELGGFSNGGGIYMYLHGFDYEEFRPRFIITGSSVDNNDAVNKGGGIFVCCKKYGHFIATNSTISGNETLNTTDGRGGGIVIARVIEGTTDTDLRNVTITQNESADGGGVWTPDLAGIHVRIANSIISENQNHSSAANNLVGRVVDEVFKHNLIGTGSSILNESGGSPTLDGTNITSDSPGLDELADNGGLTPTHALRFLSPAIDQGSDALASDPLTPFTSFATDQRGTGFPRKYDMPGIANDTAGYVDIGAYELTEICVSKVMDEFDTDLSFGDLSLREAVNYANTSGAPMTVCLPAGTYVLSLSGSGAISQGDLDISGNVTIVGDGPGISIIDAGAMNGDARIFDVASGKTLGVSKITLMLGDTPNGADGGAVRVQNAGIFHLDYSAIVGNETGSGGEGGAIYFAATASGSIRNSVITVNVADDVAGGVRLASAAAGTGGEVRVKNSIIAKNTDGGGGTPDVYAGSNRTFTSEGNNRLGNATTGLVHNPLGNGDYVGTPNYIVTTIVDDYDGTSDPVSMTIRDAIHQANNTLGTQEIWLPAWGFTLDRDRETYGSGSTDTNVAFGDLDIHGSLIIRGIGTATSVGWKPGVVDRVFELVGDYNGDGTVNAADFTVWQTTEGSTPDPGAITADGDDDGDIDSADYDVWVYHTGFTLTMTFVIVI